MMRLCFGHLLFIVFFIHKNEIKNEITIQNSVYSLKKLRYKALMIEIAFCLIIHCIDLINNYFLSLFYHHVRGRVQYTRPRHSK